MKAKALHTYQSIAAGTTGPFTSDDSWQGAYVGRRKPYGYFEFSSNTGNMRLSVRLVKEHPNFEIITDED